MGIETAAAAALAAYAPYIAAGTAVAASAVGTGMSMYSQNQQAKTAQRMADYNAAAQRQDAEVQARLAQYQSNVNAQMAQAQAQTKINNAQSVANQVPGLETQQRERARRMREEKERALSMQRAKYANSGVVNEGSPLVVLADTSQLAELNIQDGLYESELQRRSLLRQAELTKYEASFSLLEADQQRYAGLAAQAGQRISNRRVDITRLTGAAEASTYRAAAAASLIQGVGQTADLAFDYRYKIAPGDWDRRRKTP